MLLFCAGAATDAVETLRCPGCQVIFSNVDELVEHSARTCEVDGGRYSSQLGQVDSGMVCDDSGLEPTMKTSAVEEADDHEVDAQLDSVADDFTPPQLPPSRAVASPSLDGDDDHDDEHLDAPDDFVFPNISSTQSAAQFDKPYSPDVDAPGARFQRLPPVVEDHVTVNDGGPSPKTSSSTLTTVTQLIDNNVSPASKIAMLESVVYALHQQQMFQLELIEALRRQLATALSSSASSLASRPTDDSSSNTTLDLTVPRSSESTVLDPGSSLSSLMRLSAGVDGRRAHPAGVQSPATSPTALSGTMLDGHDATVTAGWQAELAVNKSRTPTTASTLLSTPKHVSPLSDLSLFKKGEYRLRSDDAITSKIKHAIKLKTSPAGLAQLLQPSLAFCFSLQPMTAHVIGCKLKQNANEGCNSCASLVGLVLSFIACFILLVIPALR